MIGVCLTSYRIPEERLAGFLAWNAKSLYGAALFITTDKKPKDNPPGALFLVYPKDMPVFNLAKTSNFAIRRAIDGAGCDVILKTDVDCIITPELLDEILSEVRPGRGLVPAYHMLQTPDERPGVRHPQLCGTTAMAAADWTRICAYRETMEGYGWEDADLNDRASRQGIDMRRSRHPVLHVAHDPASSQLGSDRNDQWNRQNGFNPMRRLENIRKRRLPWADFEWGRP